MANSGQADVVQLKAFEPRALEGVRLGFDHQTGLYRVLILHNSQVKNFRTIEIADGVIDEERLKMGRLHVSQSDNDPRDSSLEYDPDQESRI